MTATACTQPAPKAPKLNPIGLEKTAYKGATPPCATAAATIRSAHASSTPPGSWAWTRRRSSSSRGIGCSSKTPAYFLGMSHGFNSLHGRMPSVATGALVDQQAPDRHRRQR